MSMLCDISVVICAYTEERWEAMLDSVRSVQAQTLPPRDMIVVIDHNPALLARARAGIQGATIIENHEPRGLSGARNSGIAAAHGQIVAFIDEDAAAAPDWLERLCAAYTDASIIGVGGSIEPVWLAGHPSWFPDEFNWVVGCTYRGITKHTAPVRNLIGCNMSFRREAFEVVGGFRTGVGQIGDSMLRCDDTEFCIRLAQQSPEGMFIYEPQACVYHRVPSSRTQWSYYRTRCYTEGLAKALIARLVGAQDGLSSERAYTLRTLPVGVIRGIGDVVLRYDIAGLLRAYAIVAGFALTVAGYARGLIAQWMEQARNAAGAPPAIERGR